MLLIVYIVFQVVNLQAQNSSAFVQLTGLTPGAKIVLIAEPIAQPIVEELTRTQVILDPATGKTYVVIPVPNGFIWSQTGKFEPAVYNGSGYILRNGKFMPVVGKQS